MQASGAKSWFSAFRGFNGGSARRVASARYSTGRIDRWALAAALAGLALGACATVPTGAAGVLWNSGGVQPAPLGEGVHWTGPLGEVQLYDLRDQERNEDLRGLTRDGASVEAGASVVTFHLVPEELVALDEELGPDYYQVAVSPLVRAAARRVLGCFRWRELDTAGIRRAQAALAEELAPRLRALHLVLDGVVLRRVLPLSLELNRAVLDTAAAEQAALTARAEVEIAARRADERRAAARGVSAALDIVAPTLTPESLREARRRAWVHLITAPSTHAVARGPRSGDLLLEVLP